MKKILIFLITICCIGITDTTVNAETFYEAETIDGIYTKSVNGQTAFYQKARLFRRTSDQKEAYCLQPFARFNESTNYTQQGYSSTLPEEIWRKMALIAHYGYGYENHTDIKWYAITQLMIWKIAEPTKDFYFTNGLNGPRVNSYINEMNEINQLINHYETIPNFDYNTEKVIGTTQILTDTNNVLNYYDIDQNNGNARIENNQLIITNIEEGPQTIIIKRKLDQERDPAIFYENPNSQNLMTKGYLEEKRLSVTVTGKKTTVEITKVDEDTEQISPKGEGSLIGAIYGLYDINDNLLERITIKEDSTAYLENLDYGTYYLQEIQAGIGYTLNEEKVYFELNQKIENIHLKLKNKVIEREITLHKEYGENGHTKLEKNISFDIYNWQNELVDTITTDEQGNAKITLPYGTYIIKQRNTTEGYQKVEDFTITVNEENHDYYYSLYDYKIEVPNTRIKENNSYLFIVLLILTTGFYLRKKNVN